MSRFRNHRGLQTGIRGGVVVVLLGIAVASCRIPPGDVTKEHQAIERGEATSARVDIDMSAGDLTVQSGAATLLDGDFTFSDPALKPTVAYAVNGDMGLLTVSQGSVPGTQENTWVLNLDDTTPIDLHVTLSAGDAQLVLGRVVLQSLTVRVGAGDLVVDLRGTPSRSYPVTVQAGVGDTTIRLPASAALSVRTIGAVGDVTATGLEQRDGRWVSSSPRSVPVRLDVQVQHAIGDLQLVAE